MTFLHFHITLTDNFPLIPYLIKLYYIIFSECPQISHLNVRPVEVVLLRGDFRPISVRLRGQLFRFLQSLGGQSFAVPQELLLAHLVYVYLRNRTSLRLNYLRRSYVPTYSVKIPLSCCLSTTDACLTGL